MLLYYDVLIVPYFIMNKNVKAETRSLFCGRSTVVVSIVGPSSKATTAVKSKRGHFSRI
ncbi:hypothetical protein OESDEN_13447 [Oesophagostomum dentatum]|uniref:Uncharacterized protein n=1 Tax=Oesophagostomum dentatum TaxID=61180 RepID=A0A0B1SN85_OESDE|nr:hypothetical protein OESDEN_13447 [Oesophagostomum dentatum]